MSQATRTTTVMESTNSEEVESPSEDPFTVMKKVAFSTENKQKLYQKVKLSIFENAQKNNYTKSEK